VAELESRLALGRPIQKERLSELFGVPLKDVDACIKSLSALLDLSPRDPKVLFIGQQVSQYTIRGPLGHGGMGQVYRAYDSRLDREVALKVMKKSNQSNPRLLRRFHNEGRVMARLRHPNIVSIFEIGKEEYTDFLAMELVDGESLFERVDRDGDLNPAFAAKLTLTMAQCLAHTHAHGVLHRDVKPQNIVLNKNNDPLLTDFGLAKILRTDATVLTKQGPFLGTLGYASPEQSRGDDQGVDGRTDIYGLGATLYHMLTGQLPTSLCRTRIKTLLNSPS
jgi:eukaryotic-like serine/threonine-protein kinase